MCDKYDRPLCGLLILWKLSQSGFWYERSEEAYITLCVQSDDQSLRMLMNVVARRALATKGVHIRIVSIYQDSGLAAAERPWKELGWPEDAILCSPGLLWMAIQAVHKHNAAHQSAGKLLPGIKCPTRLEACLGSRPQSTPCD